MNDNDIFCSFSCSVRGPLCEFWWQLSSFRPSIFKSNLRTFIGGALAEWDHIFVLGVIVSQLAENYANTTFVLNPITIVVVCKSIWMFSQHTYTLIKIRLGNNHNFHSFDHILTIYSTMKHAVTFYCPNTFDARLEIKQQAICNNHTLNHPLFHSWEGNWVSKYRSLFKALNPTHLTALVFN